MATNALKKDTSDPSRFTGHPTELNQLNPQFLRNMQPNQMLQFDRGEDVATMDRRYFDFESAKLIWRSSKSVASAIAWRVESTSWSDGALTTNLDSTIRMTLRSLLASSRISATRSAFFCFPSVLASRSTGEARFKTFNDRFGILLGIAESHFSGDRSLSALFPISKAEMEQGLQCDARREFGSLGAAIS